MTTAIIIILAIAISIYVFTGGLDFGLGILEWMESDPSRRQLTEKHMTPVWETNHVWLVAIVVVLFIAFPRAWGVMASHLHVPLLVVLIGIVIRGCAFTFRYYANDSISFKRWTTLAFRLSSIMTPVGLGLIAGAIVYGRLDFVTGTYWETYVAPWLNPFSISMAVFVVAYVTFLASVYLLRAPMENRAVITLCRDKQRACFLMALSAVGCIGFAALAPTTIFARIVSDFFLVFIFCIGMAFAIMSCVMQSRWVDVPCALIPLVFFFRLLYPHITMTPSGGVSFIDAAAPNEMMTVLTVLLLLGLSVIVPTVVYLYRVLVFRRLEHLKNHSSPP